MSKSDFYSVASLVLLGGAIAVGLSPKVQEYLGYKQQFSNIPQVTYVQTSPKRGTLLIATHNTQPNSKGSVNIAIETTDKYQHNYSDVSLDKLVVPTEAIISEFVDTTDKEAVSIANKVAPNYKLTSMADFIKIRADNLARGVDPWYGAQMFNLLGNRNLEQSKEFNTKKN